MPTSNARINYLLLNAGVWVVLACLCLGVLAGARHLGMNWAKRQQSLALIASARGALQQGKIEFAQDQLASALALTPAVWPEVGRQLGPQLVGLPDTLLSLEQVSAASAVYGETPALDRARLKLLEGDLGPARRLLDGALDDPNSAYVLGQIAFEQADFPGAKAAFDRYWMNRASARAHTVEVIEQRAGPKVDSEGETLWTLINLGLWDEAIRRAEAPQANHLAEGMFARALKADLAGDRDGARNGYRETLALRPDFLASLRRLEKL